MISPVRRRYLLLAAILLVLGLSPWAGFHLWQRLCGNTAIRFYGRLVDQAGAPVADAEVTFDISRDRTLMVPIMHFPNRVREKTCVRTDAKGNFSLTSGYGRYLYLRFAVHDRYINAELQNCADDTQFSYNTLPDCMRVPDTPGRRFVYRWNNPARGPAQEEKKR